jgi:ribose transport system substrate-binding protein
MKTAPSKANLNIGPRYVVESVCRGCDILATFRRPEEVLHLRQVAKGTGIHRATAFRLLSTFVSKGLLERVGEHGYRALFEPLPTRKYRIGYAVQSEVVYFVRTVSEGLVAAAHEAGIELIVLNNKASRAIALRNAAQFIREKVDLVVEFQLHVSLAPTLSLEYANAGIPVITVDAPQPGAVYFGPDNYKAGYMGGAHLGRWGALHWQGRVDEVICIAPEIGFLNARMLGILDGLRSVSNSRNIPIFKYAIRPNFENSLMIIRKHLRGNPPGRVLVGAVNDQSALGVLQAFRDYGREENCAVVGQGAATEARHEMRRPNTRLVGSVAYFPETYGAKIIRLALDILEKRAVPSVALIHHRMVHPQNVNEIYPNDLHETTHASASLG